MCIPGPTCVEKRLPSEYSLFVGFGETHDEWQAMAQDLGEIFR